MDSSDYREINNIINELEESNFLINRLMKRLRVIRNRGELPDVNGNSENFEVYLKLLMGWVGTSNAKWWRDVTTEEPIKRNVGELMALVHSELSEALEGDRKGKMDDHVKGVRNFDVELADAVIRILDIAYHLCPGFEKTFVSKMIYNSTREDHQPEARRADGGKKY